MTSPAEMMGQDYDDVDESNDLDAPVPEGWYDLQVKGCKVDSYQGEEHISLDLKILGPDHARRRIFEDLHVNADGQRAKIASAKYKSLVKSLGYGGWPDTFEELTGQETQGKVKINTYWSDKSGEPKVDNQIATFRDPTEHTADGPEPNQPDWRAEMEKLKEQNSGPAPSGGDSGDSDSFDNDDIPF